MIYLASPYSHANPSVQDARFRAVRQHTANLLRHKIPVFSPIAYGYQFQRDFNFAGDAATWEQLNHAMIAVCTEVHVLTLLGWQQSTGVAAEIALATSLGKPVVYVSPIHEDH